MWIITREGFLSIVSKDCPAHCLLVRARRPGDIEKLFPGAHVVEGGGSDYRCRAIITRAEVGEVLTKQVYAVDYGNFKNAVHDSGDKPLAGVLGAVWHVLLRLAPGGRMG